MVNFENIEIKLIKLLYQSFIMQNTRNNFNDTAQSFGSNPASLKGKLQTL
jgi:hypothetical protein